MLQENEIIQDIGENNNCTFKQIKCKAMVTLNSGAL
jgi:hypothetical protein